MRTVHRILLLSAQRLSVFSWQRGDVRQEAVFTCHPDGITAFSSYLRNEVNAVFTLVVNLANENFLQENIPYLSRRDRRAIIDRKLNQLFNGTSYTAAHSLGYEKTQRKDERVLLSALTAPEQIDPWITALGEAGAPLTAIQSLPFLCQSLLHRLKIKEEHCILLSLQQHGIRESYFERGKLLFSRLSPLPVIREESIAQAFSSETERFQQYLRSQGMLSQHQALRTVLITHPTTINAVQSACHSNEFLDFQILSTAACCEQLNAKITLADSQIDALIAHLAIVRPAQTQFAKDTLRHNFQLLKIRNGLYGLGGAVLLMCALFAGKQWLDMLLQNDSLTEIVIKAEEARARYEGIRRSFQPIPISNDALREITDRFSKLKHDSAASPENFYRELSAVLDKSPNLDLESISWKSGSGNANATNTLATNTPGVAPQITTENAIIRGTINAGPQSSARTIVTEFEAFVAMLRANPAQTVKIVQTPFDIDSGKSLNSNDEVAQEMQSRPFTLEISRNPAP